MKNLDESMLTVSEFAELEGVSKQAIYKRLKEYNWKLKHSRKVDGRLMIDLTTFEDFEPDESQLDEQLSQPKVDELLNEINRKDEEIENLKKQIGKLEKHVDDLTGILRESQRSASMLQLRILQIESKDDPAGADPEQEEQKGFFVKIRSALKRS